MTPQEDALFRQRLARHHDELRWLYMELYDNGSMFAELCDQMYRYAEARSAALKERDAAREADPNWYKHRDLLGMMLYIDNFAGNLDGVRGKLDYLEEAGVNCLHLMPFLDTVKGRDDGGYAVADFRTVRPDLGTMEDLEQLTAACHDKGMNVCMDFVMNHTSCDHEWARRAKAGEGEYMSRYFFFDSYDIPAEYEKTCPQVFPTTAPGNFTQLPDGRWVMTTFYPYQWDLNYANPRVFNEMMYNFLYLANRGMDIIRIDAVPYIWKELGTSCRNLPRVHTIVRMMRMIGEIVCPSVILLGEVVMEPVKVVPYFGTVDKPECHLLYKHRRHPRHPPAAQAAGQRQRPAQGIRLFELPALPRRHRLGPRLRHPAQLGHGGSAPQKIPDARPAASAGASCTTTTPPPATPASAAPPPACAASKRPRPPRRRTPPSGSTSACTP